MPLYIARRTLAINDAAAAEARTAPLLADIRQQYQQALNPEPDQSPEPEQPSWQLPSLESLGVSSPAVSSVMSAVGALPQRAQQAATEMAPSWMLPSLESLGVTAKRPEQEHEDMGHGMRGSEAPGSGVDSASAVPPVTATASAPSALSQPASLQMIAQAPGDGSWGDKAYQAAVKAGHPNPAEFVEQMRWESGNFAPDVISGARNSSAGARGIAQIMPQTAKGWGVDPLDPDAALAAAARAMTGYYAKYGGDSERALAAYNMGEGNLAKYGPRGLSETNSYIDIIHQRTGRSVPTAGAPTPAESPPAPPAAAAPTQPSAAGGSDLVTVTNPVSGQRLQIPRGRLGDFVGPGLGWQAEGQPDMLRQSLSTPGRGSTMQRQALKDQALPEPMPGSQGPYDQNPPTLPGASLLPGPGTRNTTPNAQDEIDRRAEGQMYRQPLEGGQPWTTAQDQGGQAPRDTSARLRNSVSTSGAPATASPSDDQMYRQPLTPTMGDTATGEYMDPDQGPRESGYTLPTQPATYGDAGDAVQVPTAQPTYGPPLSEAGPEQPSVIGAIQNARAGMAGQEDLAPRESPLTAATAPARDVYSRAIEDVNRQEDAAQRRNEEIITSVLGRALIAPVEQIRRGVRLATAIIQATPEATTAELDAALTQFGYGKDTYGVDLPIVGRTGIADAVLTLAPNRGVQAVMTAGMPIAHAPGMGAEFGRGVAGAIERGTGAAVNAGTEAARGLGARVTEGLARNAENVAAADARMAAEGSTAAPGVLGAVPDEFGSRYPDIRRDVQGVVRETLGEPSAEMLADSRYPREAVHPDLRAAGIGPEITPQIDMSGRANAGAGVVPEAAPTDPLSAVNRALGQGVMSSVSGGASAAAADQLGDPNDPNRQIKAFAAGALVPPLAARAGMSLARRAGRGAERAEGALSTFGAAPNGRRQMLPGMEHIDPLTDPVIPPTARTPVPTQRIEEALPGIVRSLQPTREPKLLVDPADAAKATGLSEMRASGAAGLPTMDQHPSLLRRVRDATQPWVDRVNILRYAGMLSDTAGQVFNLQSNVLLAARDVALTPIAAAIDVGRVGAARAIGKTAERQVFFGEVPARIAGMRAGSRVGLQPALEILQSGMTAEQAAKLTDQSAAIGFRSGSAVVDFAAESPLRVLAASDAVFRSSAAGGHLMAEAYAAAKQANGGKTPTSEMMREAAKNPDLLERVQKLAARSVLQEDRAITTAYQRFVRAIGPAGLPIQVEVPFVKTPYNVMAQGMGMTPAGLAGLIQDMGKLPGDPRVRTAREVEHRLANVALGTAIMAGAASSVAAGEWTGPYPTDAKERSTLPPGWRPWSKKVEVAGQTYYAPVINAMGPMGLPIVAAILANEAEKSGKSRLSPEWAGAVALGVGRYAVQNSFFEGVANIAKVMDERQGASAMEQQVEQIAAQFSPHILGGGGLGNEIQRIMGMPARDPEGALEALLATHPATAGLVEPRQDTLGRPVSRGVGGPFGTVVRTGVENDASVIRAFRKAGEGLPTAAPKQIPDPTTGGPKTLKSRERHQWRQVFGSALKESWDNRGGPEDAEILKKIEAEARSVANQTVLGLR